MKSPVAASRSERMETVGRFLAKAGGSAAPGEIGAGFDLNRARQADVLHDLEQVRLIERTRALVKLTPAG